ncbi:type VI secretion system tube protein Hcp [Cocleimonas flava]|uniref:Type VI secretion system secreted protein Hcp n=1 Tax=Cocleimonas flava TaxID=634765 RepID=A0A4R1F005_9GAMM|nr:type VI secretion system tube protein Hcp [Cocleimonas flava]TCJ87497.1 type VI secretion system secreted protein Hcp [Cocleimonas flava]
MAVDMFLKLDGIDGEAQDAEHKKEIDVLAWSWGASQSGTTHMGAGGGGGKANVEDVSFTHYIDSASHNLLQRVFDGKHISEGTLVVRKAGGTPLEYLTIKMTDIMVTNVSTGGSGGEDRLTENVTLNFSKVDYTYKPQKEDGSADADKKAGWDIAENKTTV